MDFQLLQDRLVDHLQQRVRSGEVTERGLARITGVSQPHIHNVLKRKRFLSVSTADMLLRRLRIDLLELVHPEEWPPRPDDLESPGAANLRRTAYPE